MGAIRRCVLCKLRRGRVRLGAVALGALALTASAGGTVACRGPSRLAQELAELEGAPAPPATIILISIDTLRADHLGAYGYPLPTSPELDELARDAVVFEDCRAQSSATLTSHASLMTSRLPRHHGASYDRSLALASGIPTLATVLRSAGYRTAAVTGGGQLDPVFGLGQGFDRYVVANSKKLARALPRALRWLRRNDRDPVFLFLHTYEVHHPYQAPKLLPLFETDYRGTLPATTSVELLEEINRGERTLDAADLAHIIHTYDAGIRSMDRALGMLFDRLRNMGRYDDALIVVTSDHGEEFGEHGMVGWHSHTLHRELLRVPLLLKLPQSVGGGARIGTPVRSIDIAPTILAAVGIEPPSSFAGVNLLEEPERIEQQPAVSELDTAADVSSVSLGRWKLYDGDLYDLDADPWEQRPLEGHSTRRQELEEVAAELLNEFAVRIGAPAELTDETLEQLDALGYVADD